MKRRRPALFRTFEKNHYTHKIGFIHAGKSEHISGPDIVFEPKDKECVYQIKWVGSNEMIYFDMFQSQKFMKL